MKEVLLFARLPMGDNEMFVARFLKNLVGFSL